MPAAVEAAAGVVGSGYRFFRRRGGRPAPSQRVDRVAAFPLCCLFGTYTNLRQYPVCLLSGTAGPLPRIAARSIPVRDTMLELGTAVLFVLLAWRLQTPWVLPAYCVLAASLVAISAIDFEHMRIPTAIVYATAALGAPLLVLRPPAHTAGLRF